jgi:prophage antirepressor-like protein
MENALTIFEKGGSENRPPFKASWAVAKDIATALGYANTTQAIRKNCKKSELYKVSSERAGVQKTAIIPESDIHRLTMRSRLPAAEAFQDWVCTVS